jgi:hypothetical protein
MRKNKRSFHNPIMFIFSILMYVSVFVFFMSHN